MASKGETTTSHCYWTASQASRTREHRAYGTGLKSHMHMNLPYKGQYSWTGTNEDGNIEKAFEPAPVFAAEH